MDHRIRRSLVIIAIGGPIAAIAILAARTFGGRSPTDPQFEHAVQELKSWDMAAGFHQGVPLPARYRRLTPDGTVDLFKTSDGRLVVLFKTSVGWKQNYSGVIVSDRPLKPDEVGTDFAGRPAILIRGLDVTIRRQIDARRYEVFFDLG
jgi:hypothetical protein